MDARNRPLYESAIQETLSYLESHEAVRSIEANPYWPKWNSPWWHMSLLFEMGLAHKIPKPIAQKMLSEVKRTHLPYFFREDAPQNKALDQEAPCPCALGNIYQILSAVGLDVDIELPWARSWFLKYQMVDGGLNCDEDAYHGDPGASSLVGTIAPLEAILFTTNALTPDEALFLDRGANCLLKRELRLGSSSEFNAEEREDEMDWLSPCFPRFYFYDVLRGLRFILKWADQRNQAISLQSISQVVQHLEQQYSNDQIILKRQAYEGVPTKFQTSAQTWTRGHQASHFPLLDQTSQIGSLSLQLITEWNEAQSLLSDLKRRGLMKG